MNFFDTYISSKPATRVNDVLASGFVSAGKIADEFERALSDELGLVNPVTVNSGTAALHLALVAAGIEPEDEVIIPPQTFIATGLAVLMQQAKPVFADIQYETGNIDPESIRDKLTARTKAIMPVHWAGYPCDMQEINNIASEFGLVVVEDAAHALGATYKKNPIGSISRFTAFSFQAIKHLTTGDGGALCCLNDEDAYRARRGRWFDIDRENATPSFLGERIYDAARLGYKYHLNDLAAALGLTNLEGFPTHLKRRRQIAARYRQALADIPGIALLDYQDDRCCAYWLFTLRAEGRDEFIRALSARGVPASVVHLRIDTNSVFGGIRPDLANQAKFDQHQVSLPLHGNLSDEDVEAVIEAVRRGW